MPIKNLDLFHYKLVFVILFWFSSLLQPIQVLVSKILTSIYLWKLAILLHFNFQTPKFDVHSEGEFSYYSRACDFLLVF